MSTRWVLSFGDWLAFWVDTKVEWVDRRGMYITHRPIKIWPPLGWTSVRGERPEFGLDELWRLYPDYLRCCFLKADDTGEEGTWLIDIQGAQIGLSWRPA